NAPSLPKYSATCRPSAPWAACHRRSTGRNRYIMLIMFTANPNCPDCRGAGKVSIATWNKQSALHLMRQGREPCDPLPELPGLIDCYFCGMPAAQQAKGK